jgi:hypothetical protein
MLIPYGVGAANWSPVLLALGHLFLSTYLLSNCVDSYSWTSRGPMVGADMGPRSPLRRTRGGYGVIVRWVCVTRHASLGLTQGRFRGDFPGRFAMEAG